MMETNNVFQGLDMQQALQGAQEIGGQLQTTQPLPTAPIATATPQPILPEGHMVADKGMVITREQMEADAPKTISMPGALDEERMANINKYLEEYNEENIAETAEFLLENDIMPESLKAAPTPVQEPKEEDDDDMDDQQEKFMKDYQEAVIVIDKTGMGDIHFTEEEKEKLERVKSIKIKEVERIELGGIRIKRPKKKNVGKILERTANTLKTTNIVLPNSGYTAVIKGCSAHELIQLIDNEQNALLSNEMKWTLIYNKIQSTSIGKFKDFDHFLENTALIDYDVFIYGILCATYPDSDSISLNCEKCEKSFDHQYSVKSLIRVEQMDDALRTRVGEISDASHMEETAKKCHEEALVNEVLRYQLPRSEILVDLHIQSAKDFIYKTVAELANDDIEAKYKQASIISSAIQSAYILDPEDGEYIQFDTPKDITEIIYSLTDVDIKVLNLKIQELMDGKQIEFGLMNMTCPHCRNYTETLPLPIEKVLFLKYQTSLTTDVE